MAKVAGWTCGVVEEEGWMMMILERERSKERAYDVNCSP